ncbi:hypothetical protein AGMMS49574_11690 [Bacteroidia bacterium]|nr:hypothetical protein AGMMS49574_11690 [Bacteroidia bacterium]
MMHKANYSTNLTEKQLQVIEKLLENKTRKRKHSIAEIINAIYLLKTGCQYTIICFFTAYRGVHNGEVVTNESDGYAVLSVFAFSVHS